MLLLVLFVETLFEMLVAQRTAIRSLNRRVTLQRGALMRMRHRIRQLEREHRRSNTVQ